MTRSHLIAINPDDPRPLYVQIVDEVRRGILRGALAPEDALPSVRELARDLRVNPNTVQQAYRELEREGEIQVRRGQGSFVAPGAGARTDRLRRQVLEDLAAACLREAARAGVTAGELARALADMADAPSESLPPSPPNPTHGTAP